MEVAERLRLAIKAIQTPGVGQLAASFGIAECPSSSQTARELQLTADVALYEAKRQGRDRVAQAPSAESNSEQTGERTVKGVGFRVSGEGNDV